MKNKEIEYVKIDWDEEIEREGSVFKRVKGYDQNCLASKDGRFWRTTRGIGTGNDNAGYRYISVWTYPGREKKYMGLHRFVALAWIPNPKNKPWVNHKNGIKTDNRIENLEWTTIAENIQHAYDTGLKRKLKGVLAPMYGRKAGDSTRKLMSDKKMGENHPKFKGWYITPKGRFPSIIDAANAEGCDRRRIVRLCIKQHEVHLSKRDQRLRKYYKNFKPIVDGYYFEGIDKNIVK